MSWLSEYTETENIEQEVVKNIDFFKPSGCYEAKIKFLGLYSTPDSKSQGLYFSFEFKDGFVLDQYINFRNREGKTTRTNSKGQVVTSYGLDQLNSWDKIIGFGKPSKVVKYTLWGSERDAEVFEDAIGKKVGLCVRQIAEPSEDGTRVYDKNEVELIYDLDTMKTSGEVYFKEEDRRHISLNDWKKKIEKTPILDRANKGIKAKKENIKVVEDIGW